MAFSLGIALMFGLTFARAQEVSASLTGSVTDPSGAAIAGASVGITETTRGLAYPTTTNEAGVYFYPSIPPGIYNLPVESQGFKASLREGLSLEVNQRARFNVVMEVGAVNESVEVSGEPPLLQTDTTVVGNTITSNKIENLPLLSRNYISTLRSRG